MKNVGHQQDVDAHADVKQYPPADEVHRHTAHGQHQLSQQNQVDDVQIPLLDAHIHDGLCQERERVSMENSFP